MTALIDPSRRDDQLQAAGVPAAFLSALIDTDQLGDLQFLISSADTTYGYYRASPRLYERDDVDAVVPVYADGNGDHFVDLICAGDRKTFCKTYLETGTREDLGPSFNAVLFHLTIALCEFAEESEVEIGERMHSLGYPHALRLVAALSNANRDTFDADRRWRVQNIGSYV